MSALTDKLARLRADLAAATPGPLVVDEVVPNEVTDSRGGPIAVFADDSRDMALDEANARAHVGAVNAAPTLIDVVEAAAKRPWWRYYSEDYSDVRGMRCEGCMSFIPHQHEDDRCPFAPIDAALDRAEAEAKS